MLKIGYLPLAARGGETIGDVFGWKDAENVLHDTVAVIDSLGAEAVHTGDFISDPAGFAKSREIFRNANIDMLFVQNVTIGGGEGLFNIIKDIDVPVILSAVPEPASLYESGPPTKYLAAYCGANWNSNMCHLAGKKTKFIYGKPGDSSFKENLGRSLKVISAIKLLESWKVCVVGSKTPGYYGAIFSEDLLMRRFGARVDYLDFGLLELISKKISQKRVDEYIKKEIREEHLDKGVTQEMLGKNTRVLLALKDHALENGIDSYTIRCIPEIEMVLGIAPCWLLATLTEEGMISGCEGDVLSTLTMRIQYLLSDKKPYMFDIISIDGPDDSFLIWHCGAAAPSLSGKEEKVVLGRSSILKTKDGSVGMCTNFIPARGKINVCQLTEDWESGGYRIFTLDGEAVETKQFMPGGTPLRIKFGVNSRKLGSFIIDSHLPHHFCLNHSVLAEHLKEFCLWKDIELIEL